MSRSSDSGERVERAVGRGVRTRQALLGAVLGLALMGAGADQYLSQAPDTMVLNKNGVKYQSVKFDHKAHAGKKYLPEGDCVTCHHTNEGEKPVGCNKCHDVGGDAGETKLKTNAVHDKTPEAGHTSCLSCHKAAQAKGKDAPTKCTACHAKKA
jgi:hypothetical protein